MLPDPSASNQRDMAQQEIIKTAIVWIVSKEMCCEQRPKRMSRSTL
jgi:hypothetical protein